MLSKQPIVIIGEGYRELRIGEALLPTDEWCVDETVWQIVSPKRVRLDYGYTRSDDWTTRRKRTESDDVFDRMTAATDRPDWAEVLLAEVSADLRRDLELIVREWMEARS
jgi:hypothetical protein